MSAGAMVVLVALVAVIFALHGSFGDVVERTVAVWQNRFAALLGSPDALAGWRLYAVALAGGLIASFSPCILGMLPVNVSYMGAVGIGSKARATLIAGSFIAGVVAVNSILGLASSLFFAVFVEYRPYVNIAVGVLTAVMGLWMLGLIALRLPSAAAMPRGAAPFVMGIVFALIASPCASPVLVTVLAAAARDGSPVRSVIAMTLYSIGYTAVLFLASLFAGIAISSRRLLAYGGVITRTASVALVVLGGTMILYGSYLLR